MDWFQIGKGVHPGCILSPCLLNLYAEYTMQNDGLHEAQARIKIAWNLGGPKANYWLHYTQIFGGFMRLKNANKKKDCLEKYQ